MKKVLFTLAFVCVGLTAFVQDNKPLTWNPSKFFIAAGATFSKIAGSSSWEGILPGAYGSIGIQVDPGKPGHIMYSGEVNYSMVGSKYNDDYAGKGKVVLSYINIPIMFEHKSDQGFLVEAGVQPGFLISAKDKYGGQSYDFKDQVKSFDFGIPVGVGYYFLNTFGVGVRYTHGLGNLNKDGSDKDHNRSFLLRLFWVFDNNKK